MAVRWPPGIGGVLDRRRLLLAGAVVAGVEVVGPAGRTAQADGGSGKRQVPVMPTVIDFGARGDGVTDDGAAFARASTAGPLCIPPGVYRIAQDVTLVAGAWMLPGARLRIDHANVTIASFLEASSRLQLFECENGGRVTFAAGAVLEGYPEWWGARTGDAAFDCRPALEACLLACEAMRLAAADYHIHDTFVADVPHRHIAGVGWYGQQPRTATRIVLTGPRAGTGSVLRLGPDAMPPHVDDYDFAISISDLVLTRTARCVPPPGGDERRAPAGLTARYIVQCIITRVSSLENSIGFFVHGCVYTKFTDCFSQRYDPGTSPVDDIMRGFHADGRTKIPQFSGGNASLYIERCNVTGHSGEHVDPIAFLATGAFADIFIDRLETSNVPKGCVVEADGSPNAGAGSIDFHVRDSVFDDCGAIGLEFHAGSASLSASVTDTYVELRAGAVAGIAVLDGGGLVTIAGGEIHGAATKASLWIANQSGVQVNGLRIAEASSAVLMDGAHGCDIQLAVNNPAAVAAAPAVVMSNCFRNNVRPIVIGGPGAFPAGVELRGRLNRLNEVNCTGIDPGAVAAKLRHDGAEIVGPGEFGDHNLASGVMG